MSVDLAYIENRFLIFDAASLAGGDRPSYWEVLLLQCKYRSFTVGTTQVGECSACPSNAAAANSATNTDAWADGSNATADATTANAANANSNADAAAAAAAAATVHGHAKLRLCGFS